MQNSFESSISESGSSSTEDDCDQIQSIKLNTRNEEETGGDYTIGNGSKPKRSAKVVIIGAGLAGLAAAQRLWSSGIKDVIMLEAQDYLGGRVRTMEHCDGILELGAQYFHGAEENPIYDWVNKMVKLSDFEDGSILMQGRYFTATGEQLSPNLVSTFLKLIMKIKISLFNTKKDESESSLSAGKEFKREFGNELRKDARLSRNEAQLMSLFEWFLRSEAIENGCDFMDEVSMASYIGWTDFSDGATLDFRWGYRSLLEWFLKQIPVDEMVHINKEVTNIELVSKNRKSQTSSTNEYNNDSGVIIHYRDTQTARDGESSDPASGYIECSHVIVTASMGYLKRHLDTLFTPPLPSIKQELIKTIGYGTVNKIFLHFEEPFWACLNKNNEQVDDVNTDGIKLVWREQDFCDNELASDFPIWARDITSFEKVKRQPNLLVGWIGGRGAKLMERESDESIGDTCLRILQKFLGNKQRSIEPSKLLWSKATRWFSNPYTCGSYSFHSMQSQDKDTDRFHEPVYDDTNCCQPSIMFAGEATAGELYSTTHGAILSGWREADQLVALHKHPAKP